MTPGIVIRKEKKQRSTLHPVKAGGRMLGHKKGQTDYHRGRVSHGRVFTFTMGDQDCGESDGMVSQSFFLQLTSVSQT